MRRIWGLLLVLCVGAWVCAEETPSNPPATPKPPGLQYLEDGEALLKKNNPAQALSKFMMAWLEMPDNPAVLTRIGDVFMATNRAPNATRFYALAIRLSPGYEEPVIALTRAYLKLNQPKSALDLLEAPARMEQFAKSYRFHYVRGLTQIGLGKYQQAIDLFNQSLALAPPEAAFLHGEIGNAYYLLKKYPEADAAYARALQGNPEDAVALLNRSMALEQMGKITDAVDSLEKYLALAKVPDTDPQRKRLTDLKAKLPANP